MATKPRALYSALTKQITKPRTARNGTSAFEDLREITPETLEFGIGTPSFSMLAKLKPLLVEATKQRMESELCGHMFQYGALRGDRKFVSGLAKFLSKHYEDTVDSDYLMCTAGATNGLMLLTCTLFQRGDYVFVEDPSYFNAIKIFQDDLGFNIIPVPTDVDGVNVAVLEEMILKHQDKFRETSKKHPYKALFYTIPVFHNPTSVSLSPDRCNHLIKVLRKYNILGICDDVYNLISFDGKPPPKRLFSYDNKTDGDYKGHVVSNGSFSKIIAPGMRLGWIETPEIVLERIMFSPLISSGGGINQYTSAIMGTALQNGIVDDYINEVICTNKRKMELICNTLDKHAKSVVKYQKPMGGYFLWIELPLECNSEAFAKYCLTEHKVSVRPGSCFSASGSFKNFVRLSFAYLEEERIEAGICSMITALQCFLKQ